MGACYGTLTAYFIAMMLNEFDVRKYTGVSIDYVHTYVKPAAATALMSVTAWGSYKLASIATGSNSVSTLLAVLCAVAVYVVSVFAIKAITPDELTDFPGGDKLAKIAKKFIR